MPSSPRHLLSQQVTVPCAAPSSGTHQKKLRTDSKYFKCFLFSCLLLILRLPQARQVFQQLVVPVDQLTYGAEVNDCGYRTYRHPLHHEGLPRLIEVFHTDDSIYFAAVNDGTCEPEWRGAQNFSTANHFICEFLDGTRVASDPVPPVFQNDIFSSAIIMIRCDLPSHLLSKTALPLKVSLHATVDLEANRQDGPASGSDEADWLYPSAETLGVFQDLLVCPREWPALTTAGSSTRLNNRYIREKKKPKHRHTLSMVTQILIEYKTGNHQDRIRIQIPPINIVTWLEYNLVIGFEHFYILDNDPQEHGPLEDLLRPYIEEGTVTYIWHPMQNCFRKSNDNQNGNRIAISQALGTTTTMRRYSHETEFMGHFDVDEYIQLPSHVDDIKTILHEMPSTILAVFAQHQWYHACNQRRRRRLESAAQNTPSVFPLGGKLCVSPDPTPGKSIMRTEGILAFFVHGPWVTTKHSLFDFEKERMVVDGLFIAHFRGERARDWSAVSPHNTSEPQPLVARTEWQQSIQASVDRRMSARAATTSDAR